MSQRALGFEASTEPTGAELALLQDLVAIPSFSGQEGTAAEWLCQRLRLLEIPTELDPVGNVVGVVYPAQAPAPGGDVYLLGHLDTVAGFWPPSLAAGRLSGRGSSDAKGPLAAFICAAVRARDSGRLNRRVRILAAVEEESSSCGARHLAGSLPPPAFLIVGEPSGAGRVVLGYRGGLRCRLEVSCPVGHSSRPDPTATERAVELWAEVQALVEQVNRGGEGFDAIGVHLLGLESRTDGLSESALLRLGFRLPPRVPGRDLLDQLGGLAHLSALHLDSMDDAATAPRTGRLPAAFGAAIRATGRQPGWLRRLGTSDLNVVLPAWSCPAVVYGPGDAELDHTPQESIGIDDFGLAISVLTSVLSQL